MSQFVDLGSGVKLYWTCWAPNRKLNPQYEGLPDVERYGGILEHPTPNLDARGWEGETPGRCCGGLTFRGPVWEELLRRAQAAGKPFNTTAWDVVSWEPLTISPSFLCHCGFHGWIQNGRWVPA